MPVTHRFFAPCFVRALLPALMLTLAIAFPSPARADTAITTTDDYTVESGQTVSEDRADATAISLNGSLSNRPTLTNKGTITATGSAAFTSRGVTPFTASIVNSGSISATSNSGNAFGIDAHLGTDNRISNSGSISATSSSGVAYGIFGGTTTNTGSISAASGSGTAYGVRFGDKSFYNYGTISATSTSGDAYAIYTQLGCNVYLETGTKILSGQVYSNSTGGTPSNLYATADSDMDFDLTGAWATIAKSGSGTWTLNSGTSATVADLTVSSGNMYLSPSGSLTVTNSLAVSGGSLVVPGQGQATAPLIATGATVSGSIAVDVLGSNLGATSAIVSGSAAAVDLSSYNPNFTVQSSFAGGVTSATATYTPQDDGATLGAVASLSSAQAFAGVSQARSLTLLAGGTNVQGATADSDTILVAANGSLDGMLAPREQEPVWGVYLQPVHTASTRDGSGEGYESRLYGLEAGIDRRFGDWVLGVMIGGGLASINYTGSTFVENDNEDQVFYTAGLYAGYRYGDWDFADTLSLTYTDHDSERNAGGGQTATADYDSWLAANQLLAVYHWRPAEFWTVSPRAGLNLIYLHRGAFGESGAVNAVSYDDLDKFFADASLGVRVEREFSLQGASITPYAGAGLVHSLGDTDITVDQHLDAAATTAQVTTDADTDRATGELGVTLARNNTSFTLGYSGEYGEDTDSHSILGTLRVKF